MAEFNKIRGILHVYNDFRGNPEHQPQEIRKAIECIGNRKSAQIYLVGCEFEVCLRDTYSSFGPNAIEQRKSFIAEMGG